MQTSSYRRSVVVGFSCANTARAPRPATPRQPQKRHRAAAALLLAAGTVATLVSPQRALSADRTWDGDGTTGAPVGGTGTWDTTLTNWFNGTTNVAWDNTGNDNAYFGSVAGTVTVGADVTARSLTFTLDGFTLNGPNTITLVDAGVAGTGPTASYLIGSGLQAVVPVGAAIAVTTGTGTINTTITGTAGLHKTGTGTLQLTAANTYTGATMMNGGTLTVRAAGAIPNNSQLVFTNGTGTVNFVIANSITVQVGGISLPGYFNGSATPSAIIDTGTGALVLNGDINYVGNRLSAGAFPLRIQGTGNLDLNGAQRNFYIADNANSGSDATIVTPIVNGGFTKTGNGGLVLTSTANTFAGTARVNTGTLLINPTVAATTTTPGSNQMLGTAAAVTVGDANSLGGGTLSIGANISSFGYNLVGDGLGQSAAVVSGLNGQNLTGTISANVDREIRLSSNAGASGTIYSGGFTGSGAIWHLAGNGSLTGASTLSGDFVFAGGSISLGSGATGAGRYILNGGSFATVLGPPNIFANAVEVTNNSGIFTAGDGTLSGAMTLSHLTFGTLATGTAGASQFSTIATLTKQGSGSLNITGTIGGAGSLTLQAGTLAFHAANNTGTLVSLTAGASTTINFNGNAQSIGALNGAGNARLNGAAVTIGASHFSSALTGSWDSVANAGSIIKSGLGSFTTTTAAVPAFTGGIDVQGGLFRFGSATSVPGAGNFSLTTGAFMGFNTGGNVHTLLARFTSPTNDGIIGLDASQATALDLSAGGNFPASSKVRIGSSNGAVSTYSAASLTPPGNAYYLGGGGGALTISTGVLVDNGGTPRSVDFGTSGYVPAALVTLSANNAYTGPTSISAGTLQIATFPNISTVSPIGTGAGANTLTIGGPNLGLMNQITAGGTFANLGGPALAPRLEYTGATVTNDRTIALGHTGGGVGPTSSIVGLTLTGDVSGFGAFVKTGTGSVIFSGTKSYTGGTVLNGGSLGLATPGSIDANGAFTALGSGTLVFSAAGTMATPSFAFAPGIAAPTLSVVIPASNVITMSTPMAPYSGLGVLAVGTAQLALSTPLNEKVFINTGTAATASVSFNGSAQSLNGLGGIGSVNLGATVLTISTNPITGFLTNYTGIMSGTGGLVYSTFATGTLSGASTYTGGVDFRGFDNLTNGIAVNTGSLQIGADNTTTTGPLGGGALSLNGAYSSQLLIGSAAVSPRTVANPLNLNSNLTMTPSSIFNWTGNTNLGGGVRQINVTTGTTVFAGVVSNGGIVKVGAGTMQLTNAANTFDGQVTVNAGTLMMTGANAYTGATTVNGGTLALGVSGAASGTANASSAYNLFPGGNLILDTTSVQNRLNNSSSAPVNMRGGTLHQDRVIAGTAVAYTENAGNLNVVEGFSTIRQTSSGGVLTNLTFTGLNRSTGASLLMAGSSLGTGATTAQVIVTGFDDTPTGPLVGAFTGGVNNLNTTTVSILPYAIGDAGGTNLGRGFVTYDSLGFRILNASEYTSVIPNGNATLNNASITTNISGINSNTLLNSLFVPNGAVGITVAGTGQLTINSGAIGVGTSTGAILSVGTLNFAGREAVLTTLGTGTMIINSRLTNYTNLTYSGNGTGSIGFNSPISTANVYLNGGSAGFNNSVTLTGGIFQTGAGTVGFNAPSTITAAGGLTMNGSGTPTNYTIAAGAGSATILMRGSGAFTGPLTNNNPAGTISLNGNYSFGGINVNAGSIIMSGSFTLGTNGASVGAININGGTFLTVGANTFTTTGITLNGGPAGAIYNAQGINSFSAPITNNGGDIFVIGNVIPGVPGPLGVASSAVVLNPTAGNAPARILGGGTNTFNRDITVNAGTGTLDPVISQAFTGPTIFRGDIALGRNTIVSNFNASSGTMTFAGNVSGAGGITSVGGVLRLAGNTTYSGPTIINGGAIALVGSSLPGLVNIQAGTLSLQESILSFDASIGALSGTGIGTVTLGNGRLTLGGNNSNTQFDGVITSGLNRGGITKAGTGTFTLSSPFHSYLGGTIINGGTVSLTSTATIPGAVTINSTGTLAGKGKVLGDVTVNAGGTIAPGTSVGRIFTGDELWLGSGNYEWEITDATGGVAVGWDHIQMASLNIGATSGNKFTIKLNSNGVAPANLPPPIPGTQWIIATATNGIVGFDPTKFNLDTTAFVGASPSATFAIIQSGNDLLITYTPEPGAMSILIGGAAALLRRRRRPRVQ